MNKLAISFCLLFHAGLGFAEPSSNLDSARVTLSYKELKSLIQAAHPEKAPTPNKPSLDSALLAARYQMALLDGRAEGTLEIDVQSFSDDWTVIPLIQSAIPIDQIEPAEARVVAKDGHYTFVTDHAGRTKITLHFARPFTDGNGTQVLQLPSAEAPVRTLTLTGIAEGKIAEIDGGTLVSRETGTAKFVLSDVEKNVSLKILTPPETPFPSRWKIESEALVHYTNAKLCYRTHLSAMAVGGSGQEMDIDLPASARILSVTGDDLQSWSRDRTVHLLWKTRNLLSWEVELIYEIVQPATVADWKLVAPGAVKGESAGGFFAVAAETGMEIHAATAPSQRLPRWLAQEVGRRNAVLVGGDGTISVHWLPLVPTAPAVIDSTQSQMRIVSDGALLNELNYNIRHEGPITWQLHLPDASQLLACRVNDQPVSPVDRASRSSVGLC